MVNNISIKATKVFEDLNNCTKSLRVLEGGSRSSKTWSIIQWILFVYFTVNRNKRVTICREKLTWLRDTVIVDFEEIIKQHRIKTYPEVNARRGDQTYKFYNGNEIGFLGIDERQKLFGRKQHVTWINELIGEGTAWDVSRKDFDQLDMRTEEFMIVDYNPKCEKHWFYDFIDSNPEADFMKSTQLDNPFLPNRIINKILSYEPTEENIKRGTADKTMWAIYGLGVRSQHEGLIFGNWIMSENYPEFETDEHGDIATNKDGERVRTQPLAVWLDFGFTNDPTACGELIKANGKLYVREYFYETGLTNVINTNNPQQPSIEQRFVDYGISKDVLVLADKAEQKSIRELRVAGYNVIPAPKFPGSILTGINILKKWQVEIHQDSRNIIQEKNNYSWKRNIVTDKLLNEPVDNFNHHIDGIRGVALYFNRLNIL